MTDKRPAVVLIMENEGDERYLDRLNSVAEKHSIKVWIMR